MIVRAFKIFHHQQPAGGSEKKTHSFGLLKSEKSAQEVNQGG